MSLQAGNELSHALVGHLAKSAGIRVLAIKGFVADRYRLRQPRASADADVLVEPARFNELCELLTIRGWHQRHQRDVPSLLEQHSRTLICDGWPNDIDVHAYFPGFFGDRTETFDHLWSTRGVMMIAHVPIYVPSRAGAIVIGALHALRQSNSARHINEEAFLSKALCELPPDQVREVAEIARIGRARWVLRDFLGAVGVQPITDIDPAQRYAWTKNQQTVGEGSAGSWLAALRSAPWHSKPHIFVRAVWISRADIPRNDVATIPTMSATWRHRMIRWRRGLAALASLLPLGRKRGSP